MRHVIALCLLIVGSMHACKAASKSGKPYSPPPPRINDIYSDISDAVTNTMAFGPATNYMSAPGYVRYSFFAATGYFISRDEAINIMKRCGPVDDSLRTLNQDLLSEEAKRRRNKQANTVYPER